LNLTVPQMVQSVTSKAFFLLKISYGFTEHLSI